MLPFYGFFTLLIYLMVGSPPSFAADSTESLILTKHQALTLLRTEGLRWKQTQTLSSDAEAKTREALSALLPHIGFFGREFGANVNPAQYGLTSINSSAVVVGSMGINIEMNLVDFASIARLRAAHENEGINASNTESYQNDLIALMLSQYLNVQKLRKNLEAIQATIERDTEIIRFAEERINAGAGVELDLMRAKGLLAKDEYKKIEIKTPLMQSCHDLAVTLGQAHLNCNLPPLKLEILNQKSIDEIERLNNPIEARPDVKAAHFTTEAAQSMRSFAEKEGLPKLQLYGQAGVVGVGANLFGVGGSFSGLGGLQIVFPIYDGGFNSGKAQVEGVKAIQAELQERHVTLEAHYQIEQYKKQLKDVQTVVELSNQNIEIAKLELQFAKQKHKLGSATGLELSNAHVNLANAYDLNIQAVYAYEVAKVLYFKATGHIHRYFGIESKKDIHG